jgi:putative transposase
MRLVERHVIDKNHRFYEECDELAWCSKNLYNYCNYRVRQSFIKDEVYLDNCQVYPLVKSHEAYQGHRIKVSNRRHRNPTPENAGIY